MADFTDQEKDLLDKLGKDFERTGQTTPLRKPWQEHFSHDTSVNAARSALSAKIVEGFAGSWAAQYKYGYGSVVTPVFAAGTGEGVADVDPTGPPVPVRAKTSKLGLRGVPEINFVPFNHYTNAGGKKGPALVGHPISFEVLGPTLKNPTTNWTWRVEIGTGLGGGDKLIMDERADSKPNVMEPYAGGGTEHAYGPRVAAPMTIGDATEPNGGLYLIISDDGNNPGSIPAGRLPMGALAEFVDTAKYQIFRIAFIPVVDGGVPPEIHLHPSKRLSTYFSTVAPGNLLSIRAISILAPYVTRLQAIPGSGAGPGREQTFAILTPEKAAASDLFPPYGTLGGPGGDGTWIGGEFTEQTSPGSGSAVGDPAAYYGTVAMPIPIPLGETTMTLDQALVVPPWPNDVGEWKLNGLSAPFSVGYTPKIVRVSNTRRDDDTDKPTFGSIPSMLGWFQVSSVIGPGPGEGVTLLRIPETNPQTGLVYYGPGPLMVDGLATRNIGAQMTIHDPVLSIWSPGTTYDNDKVEAARLKNLIDPRWVGRFEKQISDPTFLSGGMPPPAGSGAGRPDKAIFDTTSSAPVTYPYNDAADPGSMQDLGFRIVLFPAKEGPGGEPVPDFNKPITSRELLIDPLLTTEDQFVDFDYSAGLVRLSHPPPLRIGGDIIPNGVINASFNPRDEVILYAACVPYSMEDSQLGTGPRLTANAGEGQPDHDLYSDLVEAKLEYDEMSFTGTAPWIGPSTFGDVALVLDRLWDGPLTGVVTLTAGGDNSFAFGRWGYTGSRTETLGLVPNTYPVTVLTGLSSTPATVDPDPALVGSAQTRGVILRREVFFGAESFSIPALTDFYANDTTYGSSARASTVRFAGSKLVPEIDGSTTIQPLPDFGFLDRITASLIPSRNPVPTNPTGNPAVTDGGYLEEAGVFQGMLYQTEPTDLRGTNPGPEYIFMASTPSPAAKFQPKSAGVAPLWHGVITPGRAVGAVLPAVPELGVVMLRDNFRMVAKVSMELRSPPPSGSKMFLGFIQDESVGGIAPTVGIAGTGFTNASTLFPSFSVIGFYLDASVTPVWKMWTRGFGSADNFISTPATGTGFQTDGPFYFVIETNNQFVGQAHSAAVKLGVYDADKNLLASTAVTNTALLPISTLTARGLHFGVGVREDITPGSGDNLFLHGVKMVLDTDRDDLPPLP
jgi:hypothetical protein